MDDLEFAMACKLLSNSICDVLNDGMNPADIANMEDWCKRADSVGAILKGWLNWLDELTVQADDHFHPE